MLINPRRKMTKVISQENIFESALICGTPNLWSYIDKGYFLVVF
jgi:hypothetical protein